MIKDIESVASEGALDTKNIGVLRIRNYCLTDRDYKKPDASDLAEYSCDAVCDNCHCATF